MRSRPQTSKRLPRLDRLDDPAPHSRRLSNGSYAVLLTGAGSGYSAHDGWALTGWKGDRTEDGEGWFLYLRDLARGAVWSAGHQPTGAVADTYRADSTPGAVTITRLDHAIEARLEVCVDPDRNAEIRRVVLTNRSAEARSIELTSYAEIVLFPFAAHAGHPAFSKLFVQTELVPAAEALLASRRPRSRDERRLWLAQTLRGYGPLETETDRARFVGRGGSLARPEALVSTAPLSGTAGAVLDPVFAMRRVARLDPGGSQTLDLVLAVAEGRDEALALLSEALEKREGVFARAAKSERARRRRLGLSKQDAERLQEIAGRILYGDPSVESDETLADAERAKTYWQAIGLSLSPPSEQRPTANPSGEGEAARPRRRRKEYRAAETAATATSTSGETDLLFDNGYGGFTADGAEYVIRIGGNGDALPPMPWTNVVANESFGFLASERGAGTTWSENSRLNRLTPWSNDPIIDPHGEALYVRDEDSRIYWSPLPGPISDGGTVEVRHGIGYSRWRRACQGIEHEVLAFVPRQDPVKVTIVKLTNPGKRRRRLTIFCYQQLVLGGLPSETAKSVTTEIDRGSVAILARNPLREDFADRVTFAAAVTSAGAEVTGLTGDRQAFLGRHGTAAKPAAVRSAPVLDGRSGAGLDPCAALQVEVTVPAGAAVECAFLLGETPDATGARSLIDRYRRPRALEGAFDEMRSLWSDVGSAVQVKTPAKAIDVMVNGWLLHQLMSCRLWGRSAFYQSGGAFGFRDQLQDSAALVYTRPDLMRAQILLHAAHQFVEGDVLHWWHPPASRGTRTRCSDDLLWLPYLTAFYARTTGDWAVLEEPAAFVTARELEPAEDETYLLPSRSSESARIYEHCCRAIDRSLKRGPHGLPLIGTCDWNDGMNRVGREGRGESIWLGFFLHIVLTDFIPIAEHRGEAERAARYRAHREELRTALEDAGWDGAWYRRAYYDDGTPLGSADNDECRIDALAQSWAVISRAADPARARQAMEAAEKQLVAEEDGLIRLLTPPFDRTAKDLGYIKGYLPGIRENGGQYTHGALWVVRAFAELGRRDRAAALLEMLTPVAHTRDRERTDVYKVEPYVVAADIYGADPHIGRGGWTWYTGSAGWMYRVALESVLGFTVEEGKQIRMKPCVPDDWAGFEIDYRLTDGKTRYEIRVENPARRSEVVRSVTIDGAAGAVEEGAARIPIVSDGGTHRVSIALGAKE